MRKTPVTLGVLAIVFGSLITLYSGFNLAFVGLSGSFMSSLSQVAASAPRKEGQPDPSLVFAKVGEAMKSVAPYTTALMLAKVAFSIALIVVGIGMVKRKRWSRMGALGWSVLALLFLVAELLITIGIVQPRMMAALNTVMPSGDPGMAMMHAMQGSQGVLTVVVNLVLYAPFPIILLALCGRRSAAADFVD